MKLIIFIKLQQQPLPIEIKDEQQTVSISLI